MSVQTVSSTAVAHALTALRANRPLVHCLTNEVVQEITANVLLAAGASPAMVVAMEEAPVFTAISGALLINTGTPYPERVAVMKACAPLGSVWRSSVLQHCENRFQSDDTHYLTSPSTSMKSS